MAAKKASAEPDRFGEGADDADDTGPADDISGNTPLADAVGGFGAGIAAAEPADTSDSADPDDSEDPGDSVARGDRGSDGDGQPLVDLADADRNDLEPGEGPGGLAGKDSSRLSDEAAEADDAPDELDELDA